MKLYAAPMEGLTDAIYRKVHAACFGGVDKYFMPFVCPGAGGSLAPREAWDTDPALNAGVPAVPQILTRDPALFLAASARFADQGYREVNLNLGCPSGTVTGKGRGAGMLKDPDALRAFLDAVCARAPLPVSVKTRIGFSDVSEWPRLAAVFREYPLLELIVHLRTRSEMYRGEVHRELAGTLTDFPFPAAWNGNLFAPEDIRRASESGVSAAMLGRGLAANPALALGKTPDRDRLRCFHDRLYAAYLDKWPEHAVVGRMHAVMGYLSHCFEAPGRVKKALFRATRAEEYGDAAHALLSDCPLKERPAFSQA